MTAPKRKRPSKRARAKAVYEETIRPPVAPQTVVVEFPEFMAPPPVVTWRVKAWRLVRSGWDALLGRE